MSKVREVEPEGFAELWDLWKSEARKSDGRGKARPVYRQWVLNGAEPQDIIDGARYHLRTMKAQDRPYIQLLSVYINSERWVDECDLERADQKRKEAAAAREYERRAAELEARKGKPSNVVNFQPETKQPDIRPSEEERAAQVAAALRQLGYAAQG